jgi:hypothetical protein
LAEPAKYRAAATESIIHRPKRNAILERILGPVTVTVRFLRAATGISIESTSSSSDPRIRATLKPVIPAVIHKTAMAMIMLMVLAIVKCQAAVMAI